MRVKQVRITGFKSFADPTELQLRSGLTGVVGPNGCGKSNIVEAMLWAMGESAPSVLRSDGMEDVIFAGSGRRAARASAEVTIDIDPQGTPVPGEPEGLKEATVARRVARGAGSTYRINGRDARARDIRTLFGDAGTGNRSFSIVRQNRIGELVNAKPADRRRILEDAAGVAGLHQRRHEIELRIAATERNLATVQQNISQLDRQLASLRRESARAGRYRGLAARLRRTEILHAYARWQLETAESRRIDESITEQATASARAASEVARTGQTRADAAEAVLPLRARQVEAAAAAARITGEADDLDRRIEEAVAQIAATEARIQQIDADLERERELASDAEASLARVVEQEKEVGEDREVELRKSLEEAEAEEKELAGRVDESQTERDLATRDLARLETLRQESERSSERLQADIARLKEEDLALATRSEQAEEERGQAQIQVDRLADHLVHASDALEASEQTLVAAVSRHGEAETEEARLRELREEAERAVARLAAEQEALAELRAGNGNDRPASLVARADEGYEAALAAALGDELLLPVSDEEGASGWLPVSGAPPAPPLPDGVQPLKDHVQAPPALAARIERIGIVDAALGGRVQSQLQPGQRLVSREGDLWRWDGLRIAASDGGTRAEKLLAAHNRLQELPEAIAAANARLADAERNHGQAAAARQETAETLEEARRGQRARAEEHAKAQAEEARAAGALQLAEERMATLTAERDRNYRARKEAEAGGAGQEMPSEAQMEDARQKAAEGNERLGSLREAHLEAQGASGRVRQSLESLQQTRRECAAARSAWSTRLEAAHRREAQLAERVAELKEQLEAERLRPDELAKSKQSMAETIETARRAREEADESLAAAESALRDATEKERKAEAEMAAVRETMAGLEARAEGARVRVGEAEQKLRDVAGVAPEAVPGELDIEADAVQPAEQYERELEALRAEQERLGPVNLRAEAETREVDEAREALLKDKADLDGGLVKFQEAIESLNAEGRSRLLEAYERVNRNFKEVFATLFGKEAQASLQLIDAEDPFEAGLEIMAQPPGKKLVSLDQMSGGEKALTAVALIFALFLSSPSPLCVLDEVDAPLDDANVQRFCNLLDEMARRTEARFLVITHHAITISRMDRLYGVTMAEQGVSQLVSVDYGAALERLAA